MSLFTFCYPAKNIGGAQLLFGRIAKALISDGHEIQLIDYPDGYLRRFLEGESFTFISFENRTVLEKESIFVVALDFWPMIVHNLQIPDNTRFLFWGIHPYNLITTLNFPRLYLRNVVKMNRYLIRFAEFSRHRKIKRFLQAGIKHQGILFMSYSNYAINRSLFCLETDAEQIRYLPISVPSVNRRKQNFSKKKISIGFISRFEKDKTRSFIKFLKELERLKKNDENYRASEFLFHIIGEGPRKDFLISKLRKHEYFFLGRLSGNELEDYLIKHIDLGMGMGTTALEFGKLGIPFVLLEGGMKNVLLSRSPTKYQFLSNTSGYELSINHFAHVSSAPMSISGLLNSLTSSNMTSTLRSYGAHCYRHTVDNHEFGTVLDSLKQYAVNTTFTLERIHKTQVTDFTSFEIALRKTKEWIKKHFVHNGFR
jgi:hypothetical protein